MKPGFESIIFVANNLQLKQACRMHNGLAESGEKVLIISEDEIEVKKEGRNHIRSLSYYQRIFRLDYLEMHKKAYGFFYTLANQRVCEDLTLRELSNYQGVSLWELSAEYVISELISISYQIGICKAILAHEQPQKVYFFNSQGNLEKILHLLCEKKKIDFFILTEDSNVFLNKLEVALKETVFFLKRIKRFCISLCCFIKNLLKSPQLNKTYKTIFFAPIERFLLSMLPVILQYNNSERLVINIFPFGSMRKMKENKILYTDLYGYKLYPLLNRKIEAFILKIKQTIKRHSFFDNILYEDLPIKLLLERVVKQAIFQQFTEKARLIYLVRRTILSYKPRVIITADISYDIRLIAKSLSVPIVAIQSTHAEDFIFFGPLNADAVTTDGNFWKEYLIRQNIDPKKIWVTGSPRYDYMKDSESIREIENLSNNFYRQKRNVIFATNYSSLAQGSLKHQNMERFKSVCEEIKKIKEVQLIVKLHPYDKDLNFYRKIAKETGSLNYTLLQNNVEIHKLLLNCDLLITHASSVSYEAVLMGKNVILLCSDADFRCDDQWDFQRYGVAIFAAREMIELKDSIQRTLFDQETISMLKENRKKYIEEHAYKLDGNASLRVKGVIDNFTMGKFNQAEGDEGNTLRSSR